jgi:hypothetical protein
MNAKQSVWLILSEDEYDTMVFALGLASGQCLREKELPRANQIRELFNKIRDVKNKKAPPPNKRENN